MNATATPHILTHHQLADMISRSLGDAMARQVVGEALLELGIAPDAIDVEQARRTLEHLAARDGLVGISARFALSRLLLRS